ncbi:MAG: hypothetical protein PHE27_00380 [Alphaproteobacteria bacterium]|nr:hypothetical protein [Alphaproteobacteria bacterium]
MALTEAHKAGTPVTWDALVAHDDTHIILPRVKAPSVPKSSASPAPTR